MSVEIGGIAEIGIGYIVYPVSIVLGGSGVIKFTYESSGGITLGDGALVNFLEHFYNTDGTIVLDGSSSLYADFIYFGDGNVNLLGDSNPSVAEYVYNPFGGFAVFGSIYTNFDYEYEFTGGIVSSGNVSIGLVEFNYNSSGGIVISDSAISYPNTFIPQVSGGITVSGTAILNFVSIYNVLGGIVIDGANEYRYVYAPKRKFWSRPVRAFTNAENAIARSDVQPLRRPYFKIGSPYCVGTLDPCRNEDGQNIENSAMIPEIVRRRQEPYLPRQGRGF